MVETKKCKHKINNIHNNILSSQIQQNNEKAQRELHKKERKEKRDKIKDNQTAKTKEIRTNNKKKENSEKIENFQKKEVKEKNSNSNINSNINGNNKSRSNKEKKKYKDRYQNERLKHYSSLGILKNLVGVERAGVWCGRKDGLRRIHSLKEEVRRYIKNENKKESKEEENPEIIKYTQQNHIWHRHHSKNLIEKPLTQLDDEMSSLEYGWTKKSEIILPDFRKKEEMKSSEIEANEHLTNKENILETLSNYTSDFDECSISNYINEHKNIICDENNSCKREFFENITMKESINFNSYKSFHSNSRTLTFTASTDKYGHTYETKNFDAFENTLGLGFVKTLRLHENEKDITSKKKNGKKLYRHSFGQRVNEFSNTYNLNKNELLSDQIKYLNKKKKNSFFCKSKTRICYMVDYVKSKWSLTLFSKKKMAPLKQNVTS